MTRVIAALGEDAAARPVAEAARVFAALFDADVEAVHIREDRKRLADEAARLAGIELHTLTGSPLSELVAIAKRPDVGAIVLGTRGAEGGPKPAGSTALKLMTTVPKPLIAVPPDVEQPLRLRSILTPLEGTALSSAAVDDVIMRAGGLGVEVMILHVLGAGTLPAFSDQAGHEERAWAREFVARHCPCPIEDVRLELRVGAPGEQVLDAAERLGPDLLALGWSQRLDPGRALVVREALSRSRVPILLIPIPD